MQPTILTQHGFAVTPDGTAEPRLVDTPVPSSTLVTHRACFVVTPDGETECTLVVRSPRYPM